MDDHKSTEVDKMDHDVMLPGFRFHPTDEELVGFYLKKKIQHRVLPIELIKQVDIYKYDPWDLPNLAPSGEKEWYFYSPRDRKYKNSSRPNRVTGAGFWKATGTDRPIYSSDGVKCIGLKKSLVFYRGRASKGIKTDWMMHEFRLPSLNETDQNKKVQDKNIPPNDAWAICRIFKKTNSTPQRALSHSCVSSLTGDRTSEFLAHSNHFSLENISCMSNHICDTIKPACMNTFSDLETPQYRPLTQPASTPSTFPFPYTDFSNSFMITSTDIEVARNNCESMGFRGLQQPSENYALSHYRDHEQGSVRNNGYPLVLPPTVAAADNWNLNMIWDSPPCLSESTTYSTNKCHI